MACSSVFLICLKKKSDGCISPKHVTTISESAQQNQFFFFWLKKKIPEQEQQLFTLIENEHNINTIFMYAKNKNQCITDGQEFRIKSIAFNDWGGRLEARIKVKKWVERRKKKNAYCFFVPCCQDHQFRTTDRKKGTTETAIPSAKSCSKLSGIVNHSSVRMKIKPTKNR